MNKNNIIAYYPYSCDVNTYYGMIQEMISEKYFVIDYKDLKKGIFRLEDVDAVYFNWIEDAMNDGDKELIVDAVKSGIKIFWVFHNRVSHDGWKEKECRKNIIFLIQNVSDIIVLSHSSIKFLYEYVADLKESKIHYLPHQEYTGNYRDLVDKELKNSIKQSKFVFGCIGSIRADKNIELTIKTFQRFSHNRESILFIAGESESEGYLETLKELKGDADNILLIPNRIPDYTMDFYVQSADILLLPYDLQTSMNSGVMLLAFSNKRTVITSNISMAEEFDDELFYKYSYADEGDHSKKLLLQMERAYADGKEAVKKKGSLLYEEIMSNNSKELVKDELYKILGEFAIRNDISERIGSLFREYADKDLWRIRYAIAGAWLRDALSGNKFIERLKDNKIEKIGLYGFGRYGRMLYSEMLKQGLSITCIIDQKANNIHEKVVAYTLDDLKEKLDIVIVTIAEADIKVIKKRCCSMNENCYVLSLKDI